MTLLGLTACDAKPSDTVRALYGADIVDTAYMDFDGDGYSPADGDCDDDNADVNPGADETPGDGVDSNCDGEDDTYSFVDILMRSIICPNCTFAMPVRNIITRPILVLL